MKVQGCQVAETKQHLDTLKDGSLEECETFYDDGGKLQHQEKSLDKGHCKQEEGEKGERVRMQMERSLDGLLTSVGRANVAESSHSGH